jgi:ribokinase
MSQRPRVTVIGSLNTDISLAVPHLPGPGETVLSAAGAVIGSGGKGANQAVAAARLGAAVRMVGCCGDDEFGGRLRAGLVAHGIDAGGVRTVTGAASGVALITVDTAGENAIAVAAGANGLAGEQEVAAAFAAPCDVLVLSAEIPAGVLAAALERARGAGVLSVLNLAPMPAGAAGLLAGGVDWLVVNEHEAAVLLEQAVSGRAGPVTDRPAADGLATDGRAGPVTDRLAADGLAGPVAGPESGLAGPVSGPGGARAAAARLAGLGARHAVITVGAAGAVLHGPGGAATVPGFPVASVDTVGAGDAFVGALAVALAAGSAPEAAVRAACAAGAAATTRRGAQEALPGPRDVLAATGLTWPGAG